MSIQLVELVRDIYKTSEFIPLHAPTFNGNEKQYVTETIDSTFVSSVGAFVDRFERDIEVYTGATKATAVVNGTAALHTAMYLAGVRAGDVVITQALTFVATCNAIYHMGAEPLFVDVSKESLGLCPKALDAYLVEAAVLDEQGNCTLKETGQTVRAVVPMHTFGHPVQMNELKTVCDKWSVKIVEDAAESLGSFYRGVHTGTLGDFGAISFNGNKIITTGGGGMILSSDTESGVRAKHLTTTAKKPHPYEFYHDEPGFNYRMPNLNAALGCAQLEQLDRYVSEKRQLANTYQTFFEGTAFEFVKEPAYAKSNYWLNAVVCADKASRDELLRETNEQGIMTRPVWTLMHRLPMFQHAMKGSLDNSEWLEARLVNIPSSPVSFK